MLNKSDDKKEASGGAAVKVKPSAKRQQSQRALSDTADEPGGSVEVDASVLESINARLSKLDILDALQQDIRDLRSSLEFSQKEIEDLRKDNALSWAR
ncbi:hypothetical protein AAFF_G00419320 [Aldrovandia affinis]|uniref:Uncharacterized protein n=1 Tax=Aldrovandia affinis TaxID=143900 RepID=A0AAD7SA33_9TELE|nr:hypothetical protein AAFF_G00419320 [Aldrovandia affinis]